MDIPIVLTGIRPGEKLSEDVLGAGEPRSPTFHPRIWRVDGANGIDREHLKHLLAQLEGAVFQASLPPDCPGVLRVLRELV